MKPHHLNSYKEGKGTDAERELAAMFGFRPVEERLYDLEATGGQKIEVKSCKEWLESLDRRRGRWAFYKEKHEDRLETDVVYLLAVTEDGVGVLRHRFLSVDEVDDLIPTWNKSGGQTRRWKEYQMTWNKVFSD